MMLRTNPTAATPGGPSTKTPAGRVLQRPSSVAQRASASYSAISALNAPRASTPNTSSSSISLHDAAYRSWESLASPSPERPSARSPTHARPRPNSTLKPQQPLAQSPTSITNALSSASTDGLGKVMDPSLLTPDLGYKLCKKIAHLTRVIANVHTRNDHHHANMCAVVQAYETWIVQFESEHASQVQALQRQVQQAQDEAQRKVHAMQVECDSRVAAVRDQWQDEKGKLKADWEVERAAMVKDRVNESRAHERQFMDLQAELREVRDRLEERKVQVGKAQGDLEVERRNRHRVEQELESAQKKWDGEKKELVQSHAEHKAAWDQERAQLLQTQHDLLAETSTAHANLIADADARADKLSEQLDASNRQIHHLQCQVSARNADIANLQSSLTTVQSQLDTLRSTHESAIVNHSSDSASHQQHVQMLESKLGSATAQIESLTSQLATAHADLGRSQEAMQHKLDETLAALTMDRRRANDAVAQVTELQAQVERLKKLADEMTHAFAGERARLEEEVRRREAEVKDLVGKMAEMERERVKERETLGVGKQKVEAERSRLETTIADLQALLDLERSAADELKSRIVHLESALSTTASDRNALAESTTKALESLQAEHAAAQTAWESERTGLLEQAQKHLEKCKSKYEAMVADLRALVEDARARSDVERAAASEASKAVLEMQDFLRTKEEERARLEKELEHARKRVVEVEQQVQDFTSVQSESAATIYALQQELASKANALVDLEARVDSLNMQLSQKGELLKVSESLAAEVGPLRAQLSCISEENKLLQEKLVIQCQESDALKTELAQSRNQLLASLAELDRLHSDNSKLQIALDKLSHDNESTITDLKAKVAQVEAQLTESYETRIAELRSQYQRISGEVRKDHEAQLQRLELALSETSQVHAQKEAELQKELEKVRAQRDQIKVSLEGQLSALDKAFKDESTSLQTIHASQMDTLRRQHLEKTKTMLTEFESAQVYLKNEIDRLTRALEAAEVKYLHRESRPEDVEKIQRGEIEIERRDRAIMAMTDEINRLRLEVQTREDSLHRLFGNRPVVGVLNPTTKKATSMGSRNALDIGFSRAGALPPLSKTTSAESVGSIDSAISASKNPRRASSARPMSARSPSEP